MRKKYNNLNEELKRMKSLFSEEKLYGNLNETVLLTEQGPGRRILDALDSAGSSIAKAIKNVDPKLATNFLNAEIRNFDDLSRHLNDYKSLWKSMGIDWDYANDVVLSISSWEKSGKLKNISNSDMLAIINDLPTQGDLRGIIFDLWKESNGLYAPPKTKVQTVVVTRGVDGKNVVHKVDTDGSGNIETFSIDDGGIKKDNNYDQNLANNEVNAYLDGSDGSVDNTKVTTDKIDANGNPDVIKG